MSVKPWVGLGIVVAFACIAPVSAAERPALRGTAVDDDQTFGAIASFSVGSTTNAGPTLIRSASSVIERGLSVSQRSSFDWGQSSVELSAADRVFLRRRDISVLQYRVGSATAIAMPEGGELKISLSSERRTDPDQDLVQTGGTLLYHQPLAKISPIIQLSAYHLDYSNIPLLFLEGGNQSVRDRLSASANVGLRYAQSDALAYKVGVGMDVKRYDRIDDGIGGRRNSTSMLAFVGATYSTKQWGFEVIVAPVYRIFDYEALESVSALTATARTEFELTPNARLFASYRRSIEETDYFLSRAMVEDTVIIGATLGKIGGPSITGEAAFVDRAFLGNERNDLKREYSLRGKLPIAKDVNLTAEVRYLDFTSKYLEVGTDMLLATVGITYALHSDKGPFQ